MVWYGGVVERKEAKSSQNREIKPVRTKKTGENLSKPTEENA
jgi:hypothetical protein